MQPDSEMIMNMLRASGLATVAIMGAAACGDSFGADSETFEWTGEVTAGQTVEIVGITGNVSAAPASGSTVELSALKRGRDDDPREVRIDVIEHAGGVTICAVYPGSSNECRPDGQSSIGADNNDVEVQFTVTVPADVDFTASVVTGNVDAVDLTGRVIAATVTGNVTVSSDETVDAATVTGNVTVDLQGIAWDRDQAFTSVTGNVSLGVPSNANANVVMSTVNGNLNSDFPLGSSSQSSKSGIIGNGGPELALTTVTGNANLRRND